MPSRGPVPYTVVGLGHIAQVAMLPAFAHARRNSRLADGVSGDRSRPRISRPGIRKPALVTVQSACVD